MSKSANRHIEETVKALLTEEDLKAVENAVKSFEDRTSGEIVVSFQMLSKGDPEKAARKIFKRLKLCRTAERNATLIVLYIASRKFAVIGDQGIDEKVPQDFWDSTVAAMGDHFRAGRIKDGLVEGIDILGEALSKYFPVSSDDINELSDELHYGH
ncbi:TPM domain-containing protein [Candidatus Neomarinimicrobiota bacterium]